MSDYYAGGQQVSTSVETHVYYLHADHLGSTSLTTDESGVVVSEIRYKAWGEVRYANEATPTDYKFTGQMQLDVGIYHYGARAYDPAIGRFLSADSVIPGTGNPLAWDRYAGMINNPVIYTDPSGHRICDGNKDCQQFADSRIRVFYGITLTGNWSSVDKRNLSRALDKLNEALSGINKFTAGTTYSFTYNATNYGGETTGGNIAFHGWTGGVPYQNYYHEIGHAIDNQSGGYFTKALNAQKVYASDGTFIMGGKATDYQRNSVGYKENRVNDPVGRQVDAQQHPGNAPCALDDRWCASGNSSGEEWAGLVANYAAENFDEVYGTVRKNWVSNIWTTYMMSPAMRFHLNP